MSELLNRTLAVSKTVEKYSTAVFSWKGNNCAKMAVAHLRNMGHKVSVIKAGEYKDEETAYKALKKLGFNNLEEAFNSRFEVITPAFAVVGDIITMPSSNLNLSAVGICLGEGNVLFQHGTGFAIGTPQQFVSAWRIPCLKDYAKDYAKEFEE